MSYPWLTVRAEWVRFYELEQPHLAAAERFATNPKHLSNRDCASFLLPDSSARIDPPLMRYTSTYALHS